MWRKYIPINRKNFIPINEVFYSLEKSKFNTWIDKLTFLHILLMWVSSVFIFGLAYFFFSSTHSFLLYSHEQIPVNKLTDMIYFSFVTATSTGFGDIIPRGWFKIMAVSEVVFGLVLLAFVTSKLVSLKQDVILEEIYDISFKERINRLRSALLLFRQHLSGVIEKVENSTISKREVADTYIFISPLEDTLHEIINLIGKEENHFTKGMDAVNAELIFNSVIQSFEKLREMLNLLNLNKIEWKREVTTHSIHKVLESDRLLFDKLRQQKILQGKSAMEMINRNKKVGDDIEQMMK